MKKVLWIVVLAGAFLSGCEYFNQQDFGAYPQAKQLKHGMTKNEVVAIMGKPDGIDNIQNQEILFYGEIISYLDVVGGEDIGENTYLVVLKNGKMDEHGKASMFAG